jgi:hypothetical protein
LEFTAYSRNYCSGFIKNDEWEFDMSSEHDVVIH